MKLTLLLSLIAMSTTACASYGYGGPPGSGPFSAAWTPRKNYEGDYTGGGGGAVLTKAEKKKWDKMPLDGNSVVYIYDEKGNLIGSAQAR